MTYRVSTSYIKVGRTKNVVNYTMAVVPKVFQ